MDKIILFATSNENKIREIKEMLLPLGFKVLCLKDVNLSIEAEETSATFEGNSFIKANDIASRCSYPVLADDSGLSIVALNGFPGVHSARFMEGHPYKEKCLSLIKMLVGKDNREAYYTDCLTFIDKKKNIVKSFVGKTFGEITKTYDDNAKFGFGYDPIFYSYDLNKTFGQSTSEEKDKISHRGKALKQLLDYLKTIKD